MARVTGKIALVTGAARGMGEAIARRLVEEGAQVMLTDIRDEDGSRVARELGARARFLHHDVASEADWKQAIRETEAAFGSVSVLVNNAGIGADNKPIESIEEADYRRIIDINQVSVFLGMKSVLASMQNAGGGSIINISSVGGLKGSPLSLSYVASKFAVSGMTKVAALEYARYNIRVNSIHPGFTRTQMIVPTPKAEERLKGVLEKMPSGRLIEPLEIANIALLLASDEARSSTGAEFVIDGGLTCKLM
jgi:3alpha(or 20beta)-hydroxysteroid dehydrogenase